MHSEGSAQGGAPKYDEMPKIGNECEVVARVMSRSGISQAALCAESMLDSSYVSRVCSGQYGPNVAFLRALWRLSSDQEIAQLLFGAESFVMTELIGEMRGAVDLHHRLMDHLQTNAEVVETMGRLMSGHPEYADQVVESVHCLFISALRLRHAAQSVKSRHEQTLKGGGPKLDLVA